MKALTNLSCVSKLPITSKQRTVKMKNIANNLKRFKLITFDCTNTLLHFKYPVADKYLQTAESLGVPTGQFDKNLMKANFRKSFKELNQTHPNFGRRSISYQNWWQQLVINVFMNSTDKPFNRKLLEPVALKLINQYKTRECWETFKKSNELITAMKDAGKIVGVISNFDPRLHDLLHDLELPKFDFVVTSYEAGVEKPSPEIFDYARKLSGIDCLPSESLHIGNELEKDYDGARNASWSAILVNSEAADVNLNFRNVEEFFDVITGSEVEL